MKRFPLLVSLPISLGTLEQTEAPNIKPDEKTDLETNKEHSDLSKEFKQPELQIKQPEDQTKHSDISLNLTCSNTPTDTFLQARKIVQSLLEIEEHTGKQLLSNFV